MATKCHDHLLNATETKFGEQRNFNAQPVITITCYYLGCKSYDMFI